MNKKFSDTKIGFPHFTYGDIISRLEQRGMLADNETIMEIADKFEDDTDQMVSAGLDTLDRIIDGM